MINAEKIATLVARPMLMLATAAGPTVSLLDGSARLGLRLLGQRGHRQSRVTDEEISIMIAEAERTGLVEPEERSMISRVMRLGDRSVRGVMTPRPDVEWLDLLGGDEEIRAAVRSARHGRILAASGTIDEIVDAMPVRAALVSLMDQGVDRVRQLVQPVPAVSDHLAALDVVEQLRHSPLNLVLVVDEHGSLEGIVTEGDILKTIVGDIEEDESLRIVQRDDGSLLIDGGYPFDELAERIGISAPSQRGYHTVAGFALDPDATAAKDRRIFRAQAVALRDCRRRRAAHRQGAGGAAAHPPPQGLTCQTCNAAPVDLGFYWSGVTLTFGCCQRSLARWAAASRPIFSSIRCPACRFLPLASPPKSSDFR